MASLHLVQQSFELDRFNKNLAMYVSKGDSILFLDDSVFTINKLLSSLENELSLLVVSVYAISEQLSARGISSTSNDQIRAIDYDKFVELTLSCDKVINW